MLALWERIAIAEKPVDVFEPPDALPFAVVWLHDEDGNSPAMNPKITTDLLARRLRCIAPIAGRSWWVDRVCNEFDATLTPERHILDHVVPRLGARTIALAGIGMGGQGAVRLGFRHPGRFPVVASLDGAFDFHERHGQGTPLDAIYPSREHARQDTAILQIHGREWPAHILFACSPGSPWHRGNDRLHEKLTALGVPHRADLDSTPNVEALLAFAVDSLLQESRRLV